MLKKLAVVLLTTAAIVSMPTTALAAKGDDLEELRADSKRANEWIVVKKDNLKNITTWAKREDGKNIR